MPKYGICSNNPVERPNRIFSIAPKTGEHWSMGPSFEWIPDVIPAIPKWANCFHLCQSFIHPDIDMDYIAISIRVQLNRFAFALASRSSDECFSMMATTFL
jgi:hypothetical protein